MFEKVEKNCRKCGEIVEVQLYSFQKSWEVGEVYCPTCQKKRSRALEKATAYADKKGYEPEYRKCGYCKGSGEIKGHKCAECQGSGKTNYRVDGDSRSRIISKKFDEMLRNQ